MPQIDFMTYSSISFWLFFILLFFFFILIDYMYYWFASVFFINAITIFYFKKNSLNLACTSVSFFKNFGDKLKKGLNA